MIQTEKIELDLFEWDVHFASNIPGPGITSHPEEMKERPSSIVKEIESAGIAYSASEYPWSSYGYYIGVKRPPQWLIIERGA